MQHGLLIYFDKKKPNGVFKMEIKSPTERAEPLLPPEFCKDKMR